MHKRFYNFGEFRLDTHNQRLLREDKVIKLALKQFELLLALVENAGDVVSKDQLFERVWQDVAIADETLTRHISFLRQKLGEGGGQKFIETVPKRGYRFAAEVTTSEQPEIFVEETTLTRVRVEESLIVPDEEFLDEVTRRREDAEISGGETLTIGNAGKSIQLAPPPAASPRPPVSASFRIAFVALAVIAVASIGFLVYQNHIAAKKVKINFAAVVKPFSGAPGRENTPAFSPDSKQLAFSWNGGDDRETSDIYVRLIGAGEPVRLTETPGIQEHYPVFSPDGTHIAFVRSHNSYGEIILIPALGGAERKIARLFSGNYSISFSPDGKFIAVVDAIEESGKRFAIFTVDIKTGERRRLTADGEFAGETTPRFSPDGKSLAFVGVFPDYTQDLYIVSTVGEMNKPVRLTSDLKIIHSLAWSADGGDIFFVSLRESNRPNIWRIGASGGAAEPVSTGGRDLTNIAASPDGKMLAFIDNSLQSDIYRLAVGDSQAAPLIATSFNEDEPDFSPDGQFIVFHSNRSGEREAWIAKADGKSLRQITDSTQQVGIARFSPDGTRIVYHASNGELRDVYVASVEGGEPQRLTENADSNSNPAWSADGKEIYFTSDRTGENQIWRVPATGGDAVQITRNGGYISFASADGKWIYYTKNSPEIGLWRLPVNEIAENPAETQISQLNDEGFQNIWTLNKNGVYFLVHADRPPYKIKFYDFSTEQTKEFAEADQLNPAGFAGLTVSSDGKQIVFALFDQNASNIMIAELQK